MSLLPATADSVPTSVCSGGIGEDFPKTYCTPPERERRRTLELFCFFCIPVLCNIVVAVSSCTYSFFCIIGFFCRPSVELIS